MEDLGVPGAFSMLSASVNESGATGAVLAHTLLPRRMAILIYEGIVLSMLFSGLVAFALTKEDY